MTDAISNRISRSVLRDGPATVRTTQIAREVLGSAEGELRTGQVVREVLGASEGSIGAGQVSRGVLLAVQPVVRVGQIRRSVLRSRRDSPYPNFPVRLFCPPSLSARLDGGAIVGGASAGEDASIEAMDSGGRWVMEFGEVPLWTREKVHAWRSFVTAADMGAMPVIIPSWDRLYQPYASPKFEGSTTFGQVVWRDTPLWDADEVQATVTAEAAQFATEVSFSFVGGEIVGGEQFSIYGPRYGWRLYRIVRISAEVDGVKTAVIRPPLREWADAGQALNFDSPRCTMRCDGDLSEVIELLRLGRGTARFVETFVRYP